MKLSARNQITGTVTGIVQGEASTVVHIDADGTKLVSSITTEAARDLGLAEGTKVTAIIKASDVLVAVD
jgi:molybdopterin-binding protein